LTIFIEKTPYFYGRFSRTRSAQELRKSISGCVVKMDLCIADKNDKSRQARSDEVNMVVKEEIWSLVKEALDAAVSAGALPRADYPAVKVEYPKDEKFGDYSSPIAMESARVIRKNPMEVGEILKKYLPQSDIVEKVEIIKPGFLNIYLSYKFLASSINEVLLAGESYGRRKKKKPRKVNIEFVSANPTGPLNVVSARAAALGDTLANMFEANGDIVDREYYVNDYGNQVMLLGRSVYCRYRELNGEDVQFPEDGYHGEYIRDVAKAIAEEHKDSISSLRGNEDALASFFSKKAVEHIVKWQQDDMRNFNVSYAQWFRESSLHESGDVMKTLEAMKKHGVIYEEEGKMIFRSTDFSDDKDRVVVRDDGRPTYLLADIAYHKNKFDRGYDEVIDIWGPDHHGYIARIKGAIKALGFNSDAFRVLIAQQVNLLSGGELVKMSKRLGNFSTMKDLVDEIGPDVTRYFFVMRSMESHLDFDLELAKKQSSENPVFYLQYAHARICSVFREAEKNSLSKAREITDFSYYENDEAIGLLKCIMKFPDEVMDAADNLEPHRITNYLMRVAQGYHKFYFEHRIITEDRERTVHLLSLCDAVRIVLKNGLAILGVSAPDRM
jgi:arginyl-tRNA synthetase